MNSGIYGGLFVATLLGLIFASEMPGAWWQWLLAVVTAFIAWGLATAAEEEP